MRTFDFHSIDLNSYLYREKLTLAAMATALGNRSGAAHWRAEASALASSSHLAGEPAASAVYWTASHAEVALLAQPEPPRKHGQSLWRRHAAAQPAALADSSRLHSIEFKKQPTRQRDDEQIKAQRRRQSQHVSDMPALERRSSATALGPTAEKLPKLQRRMRAPARACLGARRGCAALRQRFLDARRG